MHRNRRPLSLAALILAALVLLALSGIALAQGLGMGMGLNDVRPAAAGAAPPAFVLGAGTSSTDALATGTGTTDLLGVQ